MTRGPQGLFNGMAKKLCFRFRAKEDDAYSKPPHP